MSLSMNKARNEFKVRPVLSGGVSALHNYIIFVIGWLPVQRDTFVPFRFLTIFCAFCGQVALLASCQLHSQNLGDFVFVFFERDTNAKVSLLSKKS